MNNLIWYGSNYANDEIKQFAFLSNIFFFKKIFSAVIQILIWKRWILNKAYSCTFFFLPFPLPRINWITKKSLHWVCVCAFKCIIDNFLIFRPIFWYLLVFNVYIMRPKQFKPSRVITVIVSIVVVDELTCCAMLNFVFALESTQMKWTM